MTIRKTRVATVIGTVAVFASVALLVAQRDDVTTETSIELEPDQANKRFLGSEELELFFGSSQLTEARVDEVSPAVILVETPAAGSIDLSFEDADGESPPRSGIFTVWVAEPGDPWGRPLVTSGQVPPGQQTRLDLTDAALKRFADLLESTEPIAAQVEWKPDGRYASPNAWTSPRRVRFGVRFSW